MTLKDKLMADGISEDNVRKIIGQNIYPLLSRIWWRMRKKLGFDSFTAEREFLDDLSSAKNMTDVDYAFRDYHFCHSERKAFFMKPSRIRVKIYFEQVMSE